MKGLAVRDMARIALFAAAIALCAWLCIPLTPPFTMQAFGVCLAALALGPGKGAAAVGLYLLMGLVGLPVFAGFTGGIGALAGPTGGYLMGFLLIPAAMGLSARLPLKGRAARAAGLGLGLLGLYALGSLWLAAWGDMPIGTALLAGAAPFLLPDCLKAWLAILAANRMKL